MITTTGFQTRFADATQVNTTTNKARGLQWVNDNLRFITGKYYVDETTYTVPGGSVAAQQAYVLPPDFKQLVNPYVTVGNLRYTVAETPNAKEWDRLNFAPYSSDLPQFCFIYQNQMYFFPTPASSGNAITYRYKKRLVDLSQEDYATGTVSISAASSTVTGSGTSWFRNMVGRYLSVTPNSTSATTSGDGVWYSVSAVGSTTSITLTNAYMAGAVTGGSYTIGEVPILPEDFHPVPLYYALMLYFNSIVPVPSQYKMYAELYQQGLAKLDMDFGSKSSDVTIVPTGYDMANPNLYIQSIGS